MKKQKFIDFRWAGDHGIGRVTRALDSRLNLTHLNIDGNPSSPLEPLRLFIAMTKLHKDTVVFSPGYNVPLFVVRPYIFIIHDLNHIDRSENSNLMKKIYYYFIMRRACHKAFRVLTVSEFSRQRIISWAHVPDDRVVNIGNGVDASYCPNVIPCTPGYPYLLCVGNRKAHKNEARVLDAFVKSEIDSDIRLVFTGNPSEELMNMCKKLNICDRIIFIGHINEKDMPGLYRGAIALVFPSLYEGFGLPVVEAMACGTPVITSKTTSLPEVAGDAALLVEPTSIDEIMIAIEQVCKDTSLRQELSEKGLKRVKMFHWDDVAHKAKNVLNQIERELSI